MLTSIVSEVLKQEAGEQRTKHRLFDATLSWFRRQSDLFAHLPEGVLAEMAKWCSSFAVEADTLVIKQGDPANSFYAILKGQASAWVLGTGEEDMSKLSSITQGQHLSVIDKHKLGICVKRYAPGGTFGELALITPDGVRNASVIADEACEMAIIGRDLYNKLLLKYQKREFEERLEICNQCPLFSPLHKIHRQKVAMAMEKIHLEFDNFLCVQLQPASNIYFINKGHAKLIVDPSLHEHQHRVLSHIQSILTTVIRNQIDNKKGRSKNLVTGSTLASHLSSSGSAVTFEEGKSYTDKTNRQQLLARAKTAIALATQRRDIIKPGIQEVCWIHAGDVIGDAEAVLGLNEYLWSCVAAESLEVYQLSLHNFKRIFTAYKSNEVVALAIEQGCYNRISERLARIGTPLCVDLLKHIKNDLDQAEAAALEAARPHTPPASASSTWDEKLEAFRNRQLKTARTREKGWKPPPPCTDAKTINNLYDAWQFEQKQAAVMSDDSVVKALTKEERKARLLHQAYTKVSRQKATASVLFHKFTKKLADEAKAEADDNDDKKISNGGRDNYENPHSGNGGDQFF